MLDLRLYLLQRLSAIVMAPLVLTHLAVIIYASRDGLSAAEILDRTQGSFGWGVFYGLFVVAVSIHAAIGLRTILYETLKPSLPILNGVAMAIFLALLGLGGRAVIAVVA